MFSKLEAANVSLADGDTAKHQKMMKFFISEFDHQVVMGDISMASRIQAMPYNDSLYKQMKNAIDTLRVFYRQQYNVADQQLDDLRNQRIGLMGRERLLEMKDDYYNDALDRFLRNTNQILSDKIIEYDGRYIQKVDPVYRKSDHPYVLAHFLAANKSFGTQTFPTLWINVLVIWIFNVVLFLFLYFRLLPRIMEIGSTLKHHTWNKLEADKEWEEGV